ncbi:transmembrane protein like protein [Ditylenchus destructor]|nr:transmembrane protein like protein [Ditylenchus destructor]
MPILSKFCAGTLGFKLLTAECHEISHVWHPNCYIAIWQAAKDGVVVILKIYGGLYILNSFVRNQGDPRRINWKKVLRDTLRSTLFLLVNMAGFLFWLCQLRKMFGFAIWPNVSFVNSFLGSLPAIFIENKRRRPMLTLYMLNLASESLFRQMVHRRYVRPIRHGQALLFSMGLAVLFHFLSDANRTPLPADSDLLRLTHGSMGSNALSISTSAVNFHPIIKTAFEFLRRFGGRHQLCSHPETTSCISNALEPALRNFGFGFVLSLLLKVVQNLRSPKKILGVISDKRMLKLPTFLAMMPLIFQASRCAMNRLFGRKIEQAPSIAGALSGMAMLVWPNTSVAMYTLWKAIEIAYFKLAEKFWFIPIVKGGDILLYSIAAGYLIGVAVVEPQALRKNYYKFLCDITGNRMVLFNRRLLQCFGFESNKLFENYFAQLHPKYISINPDLYMPVKSAAM